MGATITPQHGKLLDPSFSNGEFLFRPIRPDGRPQALAPAVARPRLTSTMLSQSLKLQIDPRVVNRMQSGHFIRAHELWLDLPSSILEDIRSVEYHFYHPTFRSPKRPEPGASNFLVRWMGFGCINEGEVKVRLSDGRELAAPFDLGSSWDPG
jgi:hypothetical protein